MAFDGRLAGLDLDLSTGNFESAAVVTLFSVKCGFGLSEAMFGLADIAVSSVEAVENEESDCKLG